MKNIFILTSICLLFGCELAMNKELEGHWHLNYHRASEGYFTLDVINDSIGYLDMYSLEFKTQGEYLKTKGLLLFPGDCGSRRFSYKVKGDHIYLKGIEGLGDFVGKRCDSNCCDKLEDALKYIKFEIDFPQILKNRKGTAITEEIAGNFETLYLGDLKMKHDPFLFSDVRIGIKGEVVDLEAIEFWFKFKRENEGGERKTINKARLIVDKFVDLYEINQLRNDLTKFGIDSVYLTYLKNEYNSQEEIFEYVLIKDEMFAQEMKLYQWIESL